MLTPVIRAKSKEATTPLSRAKAMGPATALALVLAGALACWWFVTMPIRGRYVETKEAVLPELQFKKERLEGYIRKARRIDDQLGRISPSDRGTLEEALPSSINVPDIVANMEALVELSGLNAELIGVTTAGISSGAPDATPENRLPPSVKPATISLRVSGINYFTLKEFLGRIATNSRILDLPSLTFTPENDAIDISLVTYTYESPWSAQQ